MKLQPHTSTDLQCAPLLGSCGKAFGSQDTYAHYPIPTTLKIPSYTPKAHPNHLHSPRQARNQMDGFVMSSAVHFFPVQSGELSWKPLAILVCLPSLMFQTERDREPGDL